MNGGFRVARLIALEGIDGSGKGTQAARLHAELTQRGRSCQLWSFPRYQHSRFGKQIGDFLNGRFGALDQVHPTLASLLFAGDRLEARPQLLDSLQSHDVVICDRYVPSNIAHQSAKAQGEQRAELIRWIEFVEYELFALPRTDLVLWLDMPVPEAQRLIAFKSKRAYTDAAADLHEANPQYLNDVRTVYTHLAETNPAWIRVPCVVQERLRTADEIGEEILRTALASLE